MLVVVVDLWVDHSLVEECVGRGFVLESTFVRLVIE